MLVKIEQDPDVQALKSSLRRPAVLKTRLIYIRSSLPEALIFAFEGDEDKIVFGHWVFRVRPDLEYEPFPCNGKPNVLALRTMLERDLGGLSRGVYYFIDRDFDDLAGSSSSKNLFMTDRYSIENYLVDVNILRTLLKDEFHCNEAPDVRSRIEMVFSQTYKEFLERTSQINKRLFIGKKLGFQLANDLPDRISDIVDVKLDSISSLKSTEVDFVQFKVETSAEDIASHESAFMQLSPPERYRGKFAYLFFMKWLELLADDYRSTTSQMFGDVARKSKVRQSELVMSNFSSKSSLPEGLPEFILHIDKLLPQPT